VKASWLYKIASVLLLLFSVGHTLGFRKTDPHWGADSLIAAMQKLHFDAGGFDRTYWDFYVGFGLFVSIFQLFAALVAWQLGSLTPETRASIPVIRWSLAICFVGVSILSWNYFFLVPGVFSTLIAICLIASGWFRDGVRKTNPRAGGASSSPT
jgi:hypothetical protein